MNFSYTRVLGAEVSVTLLNEATGAGISNCRLSAGAEYYESQYQRRALHAAKRRAAQLGYQLVPMPDARDRTTHTPPGAPIAA